MSDTPEFPTRRSLREGAEAVSLPAPAEQSGDTASSDGTIPLVTAVPLTPNQSTFHGQQPPQRPKRRKRGWIILVIVMVVIGGGTAAAWGPVSSLIAHFQGPPDYEGSGTGEVDFIVNEGDTGEDIAKNLVTAGVTKSFDAFYDLIVKSNPTFVPGVFKLKSHMSAQSALDALLDPTNQLHNTVLVTEGQVQADVFAELESVLGMSASELDALGKQPALFGLPSQATTLEGFLFPATYQFDPGVTPQQALQTMVDRSMKALDDAGVAVSDRWNTIVLASLIQKEAGLRDDYYKVSRVFLNRMNPDLWPTGLLESDATVAYGTGHTDRVSTTDAERADASNLYNTYVHPGMVIAPISNPGELAIDAALHPADGPWLFFVTWNLQTGETIFSTTADEHAAAVEQWQAWMAEHPEYQ